MPYDNTPRHEELIEAAEAKADTHDATAEPALWPIYAALAAFLAALVGSVMIFGLPGLYIPMVALVPVVYFLLIRISLG
jgi:hypothetical protein